jgi:hypothetical protein
VRFFGHNCPVIGAVATQCARFIDTLPGAPQQSVYAHNRNR